MLAQSEAQTQVISIRPKVIFGMIEERFADQNAVFHSIMPPTAIGSLTLLEGAVLASLARLSGAKRLFEFGTYKGATSVLLAMNSGDDAQVITLDIPAEALDAIDARGQSSLASVANDRLLRDVRVQEGAPCVARAPAALQRRIRQILHDSMMFDVTPYRGAMDFIFIDGGHDYRTVVSDSEKAFAMAQPNAVIAWHDYGSNVHGDVTRYVDELSATRPIVHVEASMLAISWPPLTDQFATR